MLCLRYLHAAHAFFQLIRRAQAMNPGQRRMIFLDTEGHRQADGTFDADMREMFCDPME